LIRFSFDVIGGTSTGGIIAVTIGLRKRPIEEVEALYRELIGKIFTKTPVSYF
jgi:patatin-like phospholipase/acyl hydrolase